MNSLEICSRLIISKYKYTPLHMLVIKTFSFQRLKKWVFALSVIRGFRFFKLLTSKEVFSYTKTKSLLLLVSLACKKI